MKRALLLSGYHAASHARWADGVVATLDEYEWTTLTLPPRHFKWRIRGNAWWWALEEPLVRENYDLVVATSMVDLSALIGLVPTLGAARKLVYFHENQFVYPTRSAGRWPARGAGQRPALQDGEFDMHLGMSNVYAALAADVVVFNSEYNRQTLLDGIRWMQGALPDFTPARTRDTIEARSRVIPVGLEEHWFQTGPRATGPLQIVWNHRWEHDKAPERFFAALALIDVPFEVHVVGQQFRAMPGVFETARAALGDRVATWGYVESAEEYRQLLARCDVVVSTALHEFQGLAVLEAVASGCVAAVPDRLAYPEFLPQHCLYPSHIDAPDREARKLARHLTELAARVGELRGASAINLQRLKWPRIARELRAALS